MYISLVLNLCWRYRSFFIVFFLFVRVVSSLSNPQCGKGMPTHRHTHTHAYTHTLNRHVKIYRRLCWMQIRDAFFSLWYCFLEWSTCVCLREHVHACMYLPTYTNSVPCLNMCANIDACTTTMCLTWGLKHFNVHNSHSCAIWLIFFRQHRRRRHLKKNGGNEMYERRFKK